jgi:hypothetical protein
MPDVARRCNLVCHGCDKLCLMANFPDGSASLDCELNCPIFSRTILGRDIAYFSLTGQKNLSHPRRKDLPGASAVEMVDYFAQYLPI